MIFPTIAMPGMVMPRFRGQRLSATTEQEEEMLIKVYFGATIALMLAWWTILGWSAWHLIGLAA
jgi:hypothetical protein